MQFFNKYKDLFDVPSGLSVPQSRLQIDNQLFIERPYIPTKSQEYSLNGKLRQLKRDYTDFEHQMDQMTKMRTTPKRVPSRKGKQISKGSFLNQNKSNQNKEAVKGPPSLPPFKRPPSRDYQQQKDKLMQDKLKRESWLKDEQNNILKHSELDHIFSNKLNNVYDLDQIKPSTLPKPQHSQQMGHSLDSKKPKGNFTIKQRSRQQLQMKKGIQQRQQRGENAGVRREKAKDNLQFRRKKLQQLLRTLW